MDVLFLLLLTVVIPRVTPGSWLSSDLNDIYDSAEEYSAEQHKRNTYNLNSFFNDHRNKISNRWNVFIEEVKETGRKIAERYVPQVDNPDAVLTVPNIISRYGYICEIHTVISQGYVLNVHRIPHSKNSANIPSKTVLLQHGLIGSSNDWIMNGPEKALAYVLADTGYDVWMTNVRGNRYSQEHVWLEFDSKSYWNFSWHDIAVYDVPEIIDYILNTKGACTKITSIGHSMGTTIMFTMLSMRPEYNRKLTAGLALAPTVFLSNMKSPLKSLAPLAAYSASLDMQQEQYEFIPKKMLLRQFSDCFNGQRIHSLIFKEAIFYLCGYNEKQLNETILPVRWAHLSSGISWKAVLHYAQEILSDGKFQQFDYGYFYNMNIYGAPTPPEYDLGKVTLPIKLFWSRNDLLSSEKDVMVLYEKLPSKPEMFLVPDAQFNHLDFLYAIDAPRLINDEVLRSLNAYM